MISAEQRSRANVVSTTLRARPSSMVDCSGLQEVAYPSEANVSPAADLLSTVLAMATCALLIGGMCWPWFSDLVWVWWIDPNYSHGPLVPLVAFVLGWCAWKRGGSPIRQLVARRDALGGGAELLLAVGLNLLAWLLGNLLLAVVALVALIRGSLLILGGREINRRFGFAAVFLVFMAPLPIAWYQSAAVHLQQIVGAVSANTLRLSGVAVLREGSTIHLPGYSMEIGAACSGISQMTAFLGLSALAAYGFDCRRPFRFAIVLAAIPVAVAANTARVVLTGWMLVLIGARAADGTFHTLEGMATVAIGALFLGLIVWGLITLDRSFDQAPQRAKASSKAAVRGLTSAAGGAQA